MRKIAVGKWVKRAVCISAAAAMLSAAVPAVSAADALSALYEQAAAETAVKADSYTVYAARHADAAEAETEIAVTLSAFTAGQDTPAPEIQEDPEDKSKTALLLADSGSVSWRFTVPETGLYALRFRYYPCAGDGSAILRRILLDGSLPFAEADEVSFERVWVNKTAEAQVDRKGNQLRTAQVESPRWEQKWAEDSSGYTNGPLRFYLTAGEHTVTLEAVREPMLLGGLTFAPYTPPQSYAEVEKGYAQAGYTDAKQTVTVEAEAASAKSDQTMFSLTDRTSPLTTPQDVSLIRYNTIGGSQWKTQGQWLEWEIPVEQSGLYAIAFRFKQALKTNDVSVRELYIDGELPFAEAADLSFGFDNGWQCGALQNAAGDRYRFYLTAGTHTIRMRVGMGKYGEVFGKARTLMDQMNLLYRRIVVVTGPDPDVYRDYHFEELIPDVLEELGELGTALRELEQEITALNAMGGQSTAAIRRLYLQIDGITEDPDTIVYRLKTFKDNVSSYGTWMNGIMEQPLELDRVMLVPPTAKLPRGEAGAFSLIGHYIGQFIASFTSDYDSIGDVGDGADTVIRVWTAAGRDQAQILKQLINERFTPEQHIGVDLQLVNAGSLLPAVLAGIGPDVSLGQAQSDPLNFALRHAVKDLSGFSGFADTAAQFYDSALIPFTLENGVYALPETQTFPMLFYRKDILEELSISTKELETWDSILMTVLPKIQKSSLMVGILPTLQNYLAFLYQRGGTLYTADGRGSALNTPEGIAAMRLQSSLYTQYGLPLSFDFANRFRTGEMPLAVADYTAYNQLTVFAPEIKGQWGVLPVPGTKREDGTVDHTAAGTVTGCVMLAQTEKEDAAWAFMQWWTSADIQTAYGKELESVVGAAARYNSANRLTMERVQWSADMQRSLLAQSRYVRAVPEVPGGYFTSRHFDFAFRNIAYDNEDVRETLNDAVQDIDREILTKRREFGLEP